MQERPHFKRVRACVFDAYGTLFDIHSAIGRYRQRIGRNADLVSALWRNKQLEYTWLRSLMGQYADFRQVTSEALDYALDSFGIVDTELGRDLMMAYFNLDCYPDVPEMLRRLKERGLQTAILSNGSLAMLLSAVKSSGLDELIDRIISVEKVGVFKPHPSVYRLALDELGLTLGEIAFQSANAWDVAGAAACGFRAIWINRSGQKPEKLPFAPDEGLKSLAELPDLFEV